MIFYPLARCDQSLMADRTLMRKSRKYCRKIGKVLVASILSFSSLSKALKLKVIKTKDCVVKS